MRRLRSDDTSSLTVQLALPLSTSERVCTVPYQAAVYLLNDDILLGIFNYYRLDEKNGWNNRLGWCKLTHVCQRWRHLIYEFSSYLGMHIQYTNSSPMVNTLDHLPLLPLFVYYSSDFFAPTIPTQDESGIYHALQLRDRIRHIDLNLPPSILHKVLVLMNETFPILEHLSLSGMFSADSGHLSHPLPLTLPKAFLASNLRHLTLFDISLPRRLRLLTSTTSLVTLTLSMIQTSGYFRPRLLVARLGSLSLLEELTIEFSIPIPRPSTERELLGEGVPITLPSLKTLEFKGVGAYLESLVAQIRVPRLEQLHIWLFNQIGFVLPHLFYLINITEVFQLSSARVNLHRDEVRIYMTHGFRRIPFYLCVRCKPLDWQIDCAAQICDALIPVLSGVGRLTLDYTHREISTELRDDRIDIAMWHDLLRSFIGVRELYIGSRLLEELSRALQEDEVGSNPSFLPNLQSIHTSVNLFSSFIDARQVVGLPVVYSYWLR